VEAMSYLKNYNDVKVIVVEDMNRNSAQMVPRYYSGQWMQPLYKSKLGVKQYVADSLPSRVQDASFVLFYSDENLQPRVDSMKKEIPALVFEKTFEPGFIDDIMHKLNPVNRNETIYMYRNEKIMPKHPAQ
jgi:hypothetical protein